MKVKSCKFHLVFDCLRQPKKRYLILVLILLLTMNSCKSSTNSQIDETIELAYPTETSFANSNSKSTRPSDVTDVTIDIFPKSENLTLSSDLKSITDLSQHCAVKTSNIVWPENAELIGFIRDDAYFALGKLTTSFSWEEIPNTQYALPLGFSPNAKWLAFLVRQNNATDLLRIINSTTTFTEYEIEFLLNTDSRWLNNEYLVLIPNESSRPRYLFNPFVNERRPFPYFPKERVDERFANVYWFDPHGTQVAYLETNENYRSYYSAEKYVIYDTETQTKNETGLSWVISPPVWSPGGNYLAVVSLGRLHVMRQIPSQEIFLVEASTGKSHQISDFFELFGGVSIGSLTWSPDGRYLLFELDLIDDSLPESFEPRLYLFDLQTQHIVDLCLDDISESSYHWSPNGQVVGWHSRSGDLYLLDVTTGNLLHQSQPEAGLIGWLATSAVED